MPEALEWFDLRKLSKSPAKFDIDKLRYINRKHLEMMDDKRLSGLFGFADEDIGKLAKLYLEEASTINELDAKIKLIFSPKDFNGKWGEQMRMIAENIETMPMIDDVDDFNVHIVHMTGLKGENFFTPLRLLLTGAEDGPELSDIYPLIKPYLLEVIS
jgi:glutamyl-tRNA synthetase